MPWESPCSPTAVVWLGICGSACVGRSLKSRYELFPHVPPCPIHGFEAVTSSPGSGEAAKPSQIGLVVHVLICCFFCSKTPLAKSVMMNSDCVYYPWPKIYHPW